MSDPNNDRDNDRSTSSFASLSDINAWWYIAAAVILAVIIGIVVIVVLPSNKTNNGAPDQTNNTAPSTAPLSSPAPSPTSAATTGWADLGCNGTKGDKAIPSLPPKATWQPVGVMSAPVSKTYGPTKINGFVRSCYQHTPTGAVFAGINYTIAVGTAPRSERSRVVETAMTPGAYRDSALRSAPGQLGWKITAFHVDSCSPERCNLVYVVSAGGKLGEGNAALVWQDGDWHIDGTRNPGGGPVDSVPPGYVTWEA